MMKTLKRATATLALVGAAAGFAGTANAADYICVDAGVPCAFDGNTGGFSNVKVANGATQTDSFEFVLPTSGIFTLSFTSNKLTFGTFTLDGATWTPTFGTDYTFNLGAGTYKLIGTVTNNSGKETAYAAAFDFAAVPEPASWGMMIAGFALGGAALRRRRTQVLATA